MPCDAVLAADPFEYCQTGHGAFSLSNTYRRMIVKNSRWSGFGSALAGLSLLFVSVAGVADSHDGLFKRIGAQEGIATVVDGVLGKVGADDRVNGRFANTDMPKLKALLIDQV